jgi:hypothetical protein
VEHDSDLTSRTRSMCTFTLKAGDVEYSYALTLIADRDDGLGAGSVLAGRPTPSSAIRTPHVSSAP